MMTRKRYLIKGDFISAPTPDAVDVHENAYLACEDGRIEGIYEACPNVGSDVEIVDRSGHLIMPGFSDCHLHAVQYVTTGLGYDKQLLPWLETYTFPEEARFADAAYAERVFRSLIRDLWRVGTLHCAIFSSLHADASLMLMRLFAEAGLSAYVGKVNMDQNGGENYEETTRESMEATTRFLDGARAYADRDVHPILTPRFAPSCTPTLLRWLGEEARRHDLAVQSHVNENHDEIAWVKELFPGTDHYLGVYDEAGLLPKGKTIMAHGIYNTPEELEMMRDRDVLIAHCPASNENIASGIMPAGSMLDRGLRIGLGSDIGGGDKLFIGHAVTSAMKHSRLLWKLTDGAHRVITFTEAFHMGTAMGGSFFGKTGAFVPGHHFDALVIDDARFTRFRPLSVFERLQKFMFVGDDRDIVERIRDGRVLPEPIFDRSASC
jgi:guanine deaminase